MLADVTNRARSARGFWLAGGSTHFVEPGTTARLDLADHALHQAWESAGEVVISVVEEARVSEVSEAGSIDPGRADERARPGARRARTPRIEAGQG